MPNNQDPADIGYKEFSGFSHGDYSSHSWTIHSDTVAIKKSDRSVFLHHGTGIPQKIRAFFAITDLKAGEKISISLWHANTRFDAHLEMTTHNAPRSRMIWHADFSTVIQSTFPRWYAFFHAGGVEADETPSLKFVRRSQPHEYDVEFIQGSTPEITSSTEIILKPGIILDNSQLRSYFKCSPQGGMRRGTKTNSLVLISDHTKSFYVDTWVDDVFYYTGMGLTGNQSLTFHQNKTLAESKTNGIHLHLFEVFEEGKYVYFGEVELAGIPYLDKQPDKNKTIRDVYVFPLKMKGTDHPPILPKKLIEKKEEVIRKKVHKLPLEELAFLVKNVRRERGTREMVTEVRERNPLISEYAKRMAKGICQLCDGPAPFCNRDGEPFLETHHIIPLAEGGPDIIENVAALCPNCHRKMHVLHLPADVTKLKNKSSSRA